MIVLSSSHPSVSSMRAMAVSGSMVTKAKPSGSSHLSVGGHVAVNHFAVFFKHGLDIVHAGVEVANIELGALLVLTGGSLFSTQ